MSQHLGLKNSALSSNFRFGTLFSLKEETKKRKQNEKFKRKKSSHISNGRI